METKIHRFESNKTRLLPFIIGWLERLKDHPSASDWTEAAAITSATRKKIKKKKSYGVKLNRIASVACCCVVF